MSYLLTVASDWTNQVAVLLVQVVYFMFCFMDYIDFKHPTLKLRRVRHAWWCTVLTICVSVCFLVANPYPLLRLGAALALLWAIAFLYNIGINKHVMLVAGRNARKQARKDGRMSRKSSYAKAVEAIEGDTQT